MWAHKRDVSRQRFKQNHKCNYYYNQRCLLTTEKTRAFSSDGYRYVVLTREIGHANKINIVYSIRSINTTSLDQTLAFQRLASFPFLFYAPVFLRLFAPSLPRRAPPLFPRTIRPPNRCAGSIPSLRFIPATSRTPRPPRLCPLSKFTSTPSPSNRLYTFPTENFPSNPAHSFL